MRSERGLVAALVVATGCLPVTETIHDHDTVLRTFDSDGVRGATAIRVAATSTTDQLSLVTENVTTCAREQRQQIKRWRDTERHTNHVALGVLYALGVLAGGTGGAVIADANAAFSRSPALGLGGNEQTIGIAIASVGGLALLVAIGSSIRAGDSHEFMGMLEQPVPGTQHQADCDHVPASGVYLGLVVATDAEPLYVPLGASDGQGKLVVAWPTIASRLPSSVKPDADVVAGEPDVVRAQLKAGTKLASAAHVTTPIVVDPEQAWGAAIAANSVEAFVAFHDKFPTSPHADEALARAKTAMAARELAAFDAALTAGKLDDAGVALARLHGDGDAATVAAAEQRLDGARRAATLDNARKQLPVQLAAIEPAVDPAVAIASAKTTIEAIRAADADEAARADAQLEVIRKRVTEVHVADGQAAYARRDFAAGAKAFGVAITTASTAELPGVEKSRAAAIGGAIRAGHDEARGLARQGRYDDAIAMLDQLIPQAPNDATLTADRARWDAANQQVARDATARAEHERKVLEQKAAAEQAARDRAEAERKAKEERERLAVEQQVRDDAARAARDEQKRRDAEDAARRADDARQRADADRARIEADKARARAEDAARKDAAEKARLAADADKARQAAEDAKRKADEAQRRLDDARHGIAPTQVPAVEHVPAPAPPTPPTTGNPPATVQFELAVKNLDDIVKRIAVPQGCSAQTATFMAKPTMCAGCAPRPVTGMLLSCGPSTFRFVRDTTHVWLTCEGTQPLACSACLSAGQAALGGVVDATKVQVVKGCK